MPANDKDIPDVILNMDFSNIELRTLAAMESFKPEIHVDPASGEDRGGTVMAFVTNCMVDVETQLRILDSLHDNDILMVVDEPHKNKCMQFRIHAPDDEPIILLKEDRVDRPHFRTLEKKNKKNNYK